MLLSLPDFAHVSRPAIAIAIMLAVLLVAIPLSSALVGRRIRSMPVDPRGKAFRYARTILIVWAITLAAYYALRIHGQTPADIGLVAPSEWPSWFFGLALVALLALGSAMRRTPIDPEYAERIRRVIPSGGGEWVWFVLVALTAGFCEEFLYRGFALTEIATMTGSVFAGFFLSSVAFGLAHAYQGPRGVFGTMIFGALFAAVFLMTGSLWPCIIGHFAQDIVGGLLTARRLASAPPQPASPTLP